MIEVSVIVPFYNIKDYLIECFESIKNAARKLQYEVILIDDGSSDGSADKAREFCNKNKNFYYCRQDNQGPSVARNYGVTLAKGKYIFFVDGDDVIDKDIINKMYYVAEKNNTDLTMCDAVRLEGNKIRNSRNHLRTYYQLTEKTTHIRNNPSLVYDSNVWNKLIRRDFYVNNKITFPEGYFYQDIPTSFIMHYLANGVSVLHSYGYLWRIRKGDNSSTTQSQLDKINLDHKIIMIESLLNYIDENGIEDYLREAVELKYLKMGFDPYFAIFKYLSKDEVGDCVKKIRTFIKKNIKDSTIKKLPIIYQQIVDDILKNNIDNLITLINYKDINYSNVPIIDFEGTKQLVLPDKLFSIKNRDVKNEFNDKNPKMQVIDIVSANDSFIIKGHIYESRINCPDTRNVNLSSFLQNDINGKRAELISEKIESKYLTNECGMLINYDDYHTYNYNYDGCGFELTIPIEKIASDDFVNDNYIFIDFENNVKHSCFMLRSVRKKLVNTNLCVSKNINNRNYSVSVFVDEREVIVIRVESGLFNTIIKAYKKLKKRIRKLI